MYVQTRKVSNKEYIYIYIYIRTYTYIYVNTLQKIK